MVFQLLFSLDRGDSIEKDLVSFLKRELTISQKYVRRAYLKAQAVWEERENLDQKIAEVSSSYPFEQIAPVEKNILRLALYEMLIEKDISPKIAIAEAIRLCGKFSTPEVGSFVNAILGIHYTRIYPERKEAEGEGRAAVSL